MNERMLELYRQAQVPHTAIDPSNNMPYETTTFSAEKFAELIVRECIYQVNKSNYSSGDEWTLWDEAMTCAANNIREHFGVQ